MKKREKKEIKVMCALLYMMGLCLALGISLRPAAEEAHSEDRIIQNSEKSVPADGKMRAGKEAASTDGKMRESKKSASIDEKMRGSKEATSIDEKLQLEDGQQMSDYVRKDNEAKKVAITFDDGPSGKYTKKLLDGLKKRKVKATFFLIGENVKRYPEIVKQMKKEGHLIGNHTYHHVELTSLPEDKARQEVEQTDQTISKITGEHVAYMRPPFGAWKKEMETELEVMPVLWTVDPLDWTTKNVDEIVRKVVTQTRENDIILLHDCYDSSVKAAFQIIDQLSDRGFAFVTAEELIID